MKPLHVCKFAAKIFRAAAASSNAHIDLISIDQAWCRKSRRGDLDSSGYLTITNSGTTADRLLSATSEASSRVEFWEMFIDSGDIKMRPRLDGIAIPAGMTIDFHAAGYHVVFLGLRRPLQVEDRIKVTLRFEFAGPISLEFQVKNGWSSGSSSTGSRREETSVEKIEMVRRWPSNP